MKKRFENTTLITISLLVSVIYGQPEIKQIELAWAENRYTDLLKLLPDAVAKYPKQAKILFFQAFCENDAEKAVLLYNQSYQLDSENSYADLALFKLAQYHYVRERYSTARSYFTLLNKKFPKSKWADDAHYLSAQCYFLEAKTDSARWLLKKMIKESPNSPYSDLAVGDLESDLWNQTELPATSSIKIQEGDKSYYSIQVGAFSVLENAKGILSGLEKVGYTGEIIEKKVNDRIFYAVWIGRFKDRIAAEEYGKRFILKLTKVYQIVKKNNTTTD